MNTIQQPGKKSAFSLVELLVVVGVIGILLALLLPALSSGLQRARQTTCINNVCQLGQALQEFVGENHKYPLFVDSKIDTNGVPCDTVTWMEVIGQQLGTKTNGFGSDVWACPGVKSMGPLKGNFGFYGYNAFGVGADTNSLGLGGTFGFTHTVPFKIGTTEGGFPVVKPAVADFAVLKPSEMMAIGDGFHGNREQIFSGQNLLWRHGSFTGFRDTPAATARHQAKANAVFCDGHVESPTLKFLFEDTSDAALSRWNRDHLPHREKLSP